MKKLLQLPILRYMVVGASATVIDLAVFSLTIYQLQWDFRIAITGGFIAGVFINFILCDRFIFKRTTTWWHACSKHYLASLGGLLLNQLGMIALLSIFGHTHLVGKRLAVSAFTFLVNFLLIKTVVFKNG